MQNDSDLPDLNLISSMSEGARPNIPRHMPSLKKTKSVTQKTWINLLTYNVFLRPPLINNNGDDYKNERLAVFKNYLSEFDIINFQELFQTLNRRKTEMVKYAKERGLVWTAICPRFPFFSKFLIDSGLMTISRYPYLEVDFKAFTYNAGVDGLAYKGVLYTKISLKEGKRILHLFNIHTQASYSTKYTHDQHSHFESRLNQLIVARETITEFLGKYSNLNEVGAENFKDLVLIGGDFNVDARGHPIPNNFKLKCAVAQQYMKTHDPEKLTEYQLLTYILSAYEEDNVVDFLKEQHDGHHPTTYGDVVMEGGVEVPGETCLTSKEDLGSKMCLDFIFQILPGKVMDNKLDAFCTVRKFKVKGHPFTQLSDHYGVELSFRP